MLLTKKQRKKSSENNTLSPYRGQGNNVTAINPADEAPREERIEAN